MIFMRRTALSLLMAATALCAHASDDLRMVVGTYTDTGSDGIYTYVFNQQTGSAHVLDSLSLRDPSYLTITHDGRMLYAVSERPDSTASLSAIRLNAVTGHMTFVNTQPTGGADPCYVETRGRIALTANYTGGNMSVFPIREDGSLGPREALYKGHITNEPAPQQVPHIHMTRFLSDSVILASDFSADQLLRFRTDGQKVWSDGVAGKLLSGSAPRHMEFSADLRFVYVMSEMAGTVTVFRNNHAVLERIQTIASDSVGGRGGADLHLSHDGRYLYASNRLKADGISIFKVNGKTGLLKKVGYVRTGIHPRNFNITPNDQFLLCACRDSNVIEVYRRDTVSGSLTLSSRLKVKKPVCIKFVTTSLSAGSQSTVCR